MAARYLGIYVYRSVVYIHVYGPCTQTAAVCNSITLHAIYKAFFTEVQQTDKKTNTETEKKTNATQTT